MTCRVGARLTVSVKYRLVVRVSHQGANTVNNRAMPDICLQHMCAVMLIDGIVTFGGYDAVAEPGQFPTDYKFKNDTWKWRPAN